MSKIIAIANQKGGVGKSTTAINLSASLAEMGRRILVIDLDAQANTTSGLGVDKNEPEHSLYDIMTDEASWKECVLKEVVENLDLIPSSTLMSGIECELFTKWQREFVLRKGLERIKASGRYDFILIDAPPTLGGWVMNIMCASDFLIVPVEASPWGLFGLANMFEFTNQVQTIAPALKLLGIAVTKADERKNYYRQTVETLGELEDVTLFQSIIRIDSAVEWSQDNSKPVLAYKRSSRSAKEYFELTKEILEHVSR